MQRQKIIIASVDCVTSTNMLSRDSEFSGTLAGACDADHGQMRPTTARSAERSY